MDRSIRAGITGLVLSVLINLFVPIPYPIIAFLPSFFASIFVIYTFRLGAVKDGLLAAFIIYIFSEGVLDTIGVAGLFIEGQPYRLTVDIALVFTPIVNAISALIAGYIGAQLAHRARPLRESQPQVQASLPPPIPPV